VALTIPNEGSATYSDQAEPDSVDFDALALGFQRVGVISGCAVAQRAAGANMSVDVAAGSVIVGATGAAVTAVNKTIGTADATNPRFDLITVNSSGTVSVTAGTAASNAVFPAIPASSVLLAAVYVPASATSVVTAQIVDKRVILARQGFRSGVYPVNGRYFTAQGPYSGDGTTQPANGDMRMYPLDVARTVAVDRIAGQVGTAGSAGALVRYGIYAADPDTGLPAGLVLDAGTAAATSSGVDVNITVSLTLTPGRYWLAYVTQGAPATLPIVRAFNATAAQGNDPAGDAGGNSTGPSLSFVVATGAAVNTGVTGALPGTASAPAWSAVVQRPQVWLRAAS
jgi:hypothetical protein